MKNTTKKLLAAMMTALLVAVAFVGVAAAEDGVTISVDKSELKNLWTNDTTVYTKYWTLKGQDIEIPFYVTGTGDNYKYLAGYVVTFAGNLTELGSGEGTATYGNASSVWNDRSLAVNEDTKTIAKAVDAVDVLNITSGNRTFKIAVAGINPSGTDIGSTGIYKLYNVTLENLNGNFSTTAKNVSTMTSYTDLPAAVTASLNPSAGFFYNNNKEFVIAVRDHINNTKFTFPDYNTTITGVDTNPDTVYIYLEHEKGQNPAKEVNVTATLNYSFDTGYDTNAWKLDSGGNNFSITSPVDPAADNKKNLSNVLTIKGDSLSGAESKTGTLNLTINNAISAAKNVTNVKLNLSNWNTAYETNNYSATGFGDYNSQTKWSFVTNLTANYTIRAGPVNTSVSSDGWNTSVLFKNITVPEHENIQWTPNVTILDGPTEEPNYVINKLDAVDGSKNLTSGRYFNVTTNTVKNGEKTLTIMLTGYRLGDANIDRKVDIVDSAVVGVTVLKDGTSEDLEFLPEENRIYADCGNQDPDGDIDVVDILAINKYLVGSDPWETA